KKERDAIRSKNYVRITEKETIEVIEEIEGTLTKLRMNQSKENNTSKPKAKSTNKFLIIANSKLLQKGLAVASGINIVVLENIKNNQRSKESKMSKPKTKPTNKSSIISNSKSSKKDLLAVASGINDVVLETPVSIKDNQQKEKKKISKNSSQKDLPVA
ncbi:7348_t:CDS:2, partial [Gigaspora rosea]